MSVTCLFMVLALLVALDLEFALAPYLALDGGNGNDLGRNLDLALACARDLASALAYVVVVGGGGG
eukprot:13759348-Alexandrium_andersonii.AAC.1